MAYTPEPTHTVDETLGPPQLDREFWALFNNDLNLKDFVVGAMPIKGAMLILDGAGGADGGGPNTTLPTIEDSYNIDTSVNAGAGLVRTGEGVYLFTLRVNQIADQDILARIYPAFSVVVGSALHPDINAQLIDIQLTDADVPGGTLEISVRQFVVPANGKGEFEPYDLRNSGSGAADRMWMTGLLNLSGRSIDYPDTP